MSIQTANEIVSLVIISRFFYEAGIEGILKLYFTRALRNKTHESIQTVNLALNF